MVVDGAILIDDEMQTNLSLGFDQMRLNSFENKNMYEHCKRVEKVSKGKKRKIDEIKK